MSFQPGRADNPSWSHVAPADLHEHHLPRQVMFGFHRGRTEELLKRAADTIARLTRQLAEARGEDLVQERAERLAGQALLDAHKLAKVLHAEAETELAAARKEMERVAAAAEQYRLLAADVRRRSIEALQRAIEELGESADAAEPGSEPATADEVTPTPFRKPGRPA